MLPQKHLKSRLSSNPSLAEIATESGENAYKSEPTDKCGSRVENSPSADFQSHFIIRRSSERGIIGQLDQSSRISEDINEDLTPTSPNTLPDTACRLTSQRLPCKFSVEKDTQEKSDSRPVTAPPSTEGACVLIDRSNSHTLTAQKTRSSREKTSLHPFMRTFGVRAESITPKQLISMPESPMDGTYHPVSRYCEKKRQEIVKSSEASEKISSTPYETMLNACLQRDSMPIELIFSGLTDLEKIGEGVYGEVYSGTFRLCNRASWVYKVVAIGGSAMVNGERQKTLSEILPEIIVSQELSKLRQGLNKCRTNGFVFMRNARLAKGQYPGVLLKCWETFNEKFESDNDRPEFSKEQLYMVLEFEFAGGDIESFNFKDARQTLSIVLQVAHILAVGECALEFEHRDLHWGNILVEAWTPAQISYLIDGKTYPVPAIGVKAVVIDFTVSRLLDPKSKPIFLDLQEDEEQFLGTGDHQFDIYRMMRDHNRNNWERFSPKTNIFWLHYLADKLFIKGRYSSSRSHVHTKAIRKLRDFAQLIFEYESATSFVSSTLCESDTEFLLTSVVNPEANS